MNISPSKSPLKLTQTCLFHALFPDLFFKSEGTNYFPNIVILLSDGQKHKKKPSPTATEVIQTSLGIEKIFSKIFRFDFGLKNAFFSYETQFQSIERKFHMASMNFLPSTLNYPHAQILPFYPKAIVRI